MMTPKYARKAKRGSKLGVARYATPASVVYSNRPPIALQREKDVVSVLAKRHEQLGSWRVLAYELKYNAATLCKIVKTANDKKPRTATAELVKRMNETYGCHIVYQPKPVLVPPCHKCGAVHLSKRCTAKDKTRTRQPDPVIRVKKLKRIIDGAPLSPEMKRELLNMLGVKP